MTTTDQARDSARLRSLLSVAELVLWRAQFGDFPRETGWNDKMQAMREFERLRRKEAVEETAKEMKGAA